METIKAEPNQTIWDIAVQYCGNAEAVVELMCNNPQLENDPQALEALGIDPAEDGFYWDAPLAAGLEVRIDPQSTLMRPTVAKEIREAVTTFDLE